MAQGYAGVPEGPLSAYLGVRDMNERRSLSDLQHVMIAQQLKSKLQAEQRAMQFQSELANAKTPDEQIAVATKYGAPQDVLRTISASQDRQTALKASEASIQEKFNQQKEIEKQRALDRENLAKTVASLKTPAQEPAPVSVVGPDGKPVLVSRKDAIGKQPFSASIAGSGAMNPETLTFTAKQYLTGDRQAVQGYARNATARIALQNAIVDEAAKMGLSPEQTASKMAEFAGTVAGSRTVGQRAANISLAATEAREMLGIVQETSDKFSRTNFVPWNMALKAYDTGTGEPEIAAFGASINALVNVYARAINPTGVPTVSDKEHARAVINSVQSPAQVKAVLAIIDRELSIAQKAPEQVREGIRQSITGNKSWDEDKEKRYQEWKAKQK